MFSLRNMRAGALCDEKGLKGMIIVMLSPYKEMCPLFYNHYPTVFQEKHDKVRGYPSHRHILWLIKIHLST